MSRLRDLGERQIIREIVSKFVSRGFGSDCADWRPKGPILVTSVDPVPPAAAEVIGRDPDWYWKGWLLVTINASDIAASGGEPECFVAAIDAHADSEVAAFERLLNGIRDACAEYGFEYVGGNIREAERFAAVGTAIGSGGSELLSRFGATPGDKVYVVGAIGAFWTDGLSLLDGGIIEEPERSPVFKPIAATNAMRSIAKAGVASCAMDNSDGLLPTLEQLAEANNQRIALDLDALRENRASIKYQGVPVDGARLCMGWGDWNVVISVPTENEGQLKSIADECGFDVTYCGSVLEGRGLVVGSATDGQGDAPRIESERFCTDSWFGGGIEGYVRMLLETEIPKRV